MPTRCPIIEEEKATVQQERDTNGPDNSRQAQQAELRRLRDRLDDVPARGGPFIRRFKP
ncbi:MAG TPA: hypothetical protein VM487_06050 [Phycisphaerae bacterium]|nr:hypothetical protein [Phycisphaerae bacterium]